MKIIKRLETEDSRIVLINQVNLGVGGARNRGLKAATGELIAWCDSDDYVEPNWLENMYQNLCDYKADVCICGTRIPGRVVQNNQRQDDVWEYDQILEKFLEQRELNGVLWNKLIWRKFFDGISFESDIHFWEDLRVVWKILQRTKKVVRLYTPVYNFVVHEGSATAQKMNPKRVHSSFAVWDEIVNDCNSSNLGQYKQQASVKRATSLFGELRLFFRDNYYDRMAEKQIQHYMREKAGYVLKQKNSLGYKISYSVCLVSVPLARGLYKMVRAEKHVLVKR